MQRIGRRRRYPAKYTKNPIHTPPLEESTVELVDRRKRKARRWAAATALGLFFWLLVGMLLLAIVIRYL
jgi:hypothetical protein